MARTLKSFGYNKVECTSCYSIYYNKNGKYYLYDKSRYTMTEIDATERLCKRCKAHYIGMQWLV